jgi:hypothetical protein
LRAYSNELEATEQGAYAVSFAAVEALAGLVAVRRAETLTGADYYVAPIGTDPEDMESCLRMEVSGVGAGNETIIHARLRQKLRQTEKGRSNLPALAAVVGFRDSLASRANIHQNGLFTSQPPAERSFSPTVPKLFSPDGLMLGPVFRLLKLSESPALRPLGGTSTFSRPSIIDFLLLGSPRQQHLSVPRQTTANYVRTTASSLRSFLRHCEVF